LVSSHGNASESVTTLDADRRQAKYFYDELRRQIELLNEQADVCRAALASCLRRDELHRIRRIQDELQRNALERRRLVDMLSALNHRFGGPETEARPVSSPRHRTPAAPAPLNRVSGSRATTAPAR
jgi:hypothetical protein